MSAAVRRANKASAAELALSIPKAKSSKAPFRFQVFTASELSKDDRLTLWEILDDNMRELCANSSLGWDPPAKKQETFDPLSRFIIAYEKRPKVSDSGDKIADSSDAIVGFTMFRFEHEEGEDLVYCYEIQVSKTGQRRGLGRQFIRQLEKIGVRYRMQKIMLTALKANTGAREFYTSMGFLMDPASPDYIDEDEDEDEDKDEDEEKAEEVEVDYEILSKILR